MKREQWHACNEPQGMLEFLKARGSVTPRKGRLFAVAVCRRLWHLLPDHRLRRAVKIAERFADGHASKGELHQAHLAAWTAEGSLKGIRPTKSPETAKAAARLASWVARQAANPEGPDQLAWLTTVAADAWKAGVVNADLAKNIANPGRGIAERQRESARLADLVREVFSAFTCPAVSPLESDSWPRRMAEDIYWTGRFEELPILADAIEEGACADAAVLAHLRSPGPHVRGCYALDALITRA